MSKHDIINHIRRINTSAPEEFLASFSDEELLAYLHQLHELQREQLRRRECEPVLAVQD